jgi:hypothetical protein
MIIDDFDVVGVAFGEQEADTPTAVDGHSPLAFPVTLELVKSYALEGTQILQSLGHVDDPPPFRQAVDRALHLDPELGEAHTRAGPKIAEGGELDMRALLGDEQGALDMLEESSARREFNLPLYYRMPVFDGLRNDPRFVAIAEGPGLRP